MKNLEIAEKLIQNKLNEVINDELINYYSTQEIFLTYLILLKIMNMI